jgi:membrane-bound lytic murein transglycosylase MltF
MSHHLSLNMKEILCSLTVLVSIAANAQTVHIFSSTDSEGKMSWSTQALDDTYIHIAGLSTQTIEHRHIPDTQIQPTRLSQVVAKRRQTWQHSVDSTAQRYGVDPRWVSALIEVESGFNPYAVSPKGAIGLMQLMPVTATRYGVRDKRQLFDPALNLDIGVRHLKDLLNEHHGNIALAMASYNAGSGAVAKHGKRIPQFNETMLYVPAVLAAATRISIETTHEVTNIR